jgi:Zn-dependent M16 (insulinase) family peptidase
MGEICEIFQEYNFADKRRLKEIIKVNMTNL